MKSGVQMSSIAVVGLGRSGLGAARLLHAEGHDVTVLESKPSGTPDVDRLREVGVDVRLGCPLDPDPFATWQGPLDRVVISPGISWTHPTLNRLRDRGVPVCGEMAVAWRSLGDTPWIGITGTNGKTTVTHLLHHVLSHGGLQAPMAGNVGFSAAELALLAKDPSLPRQDWVVMEMSSYQIEAAQSVAPKIGIWTTLTPDHLERHGTLESYRAIKQGLLERSDHAVLNGDDPDLQRYQQHLSNATWVSTKPEPVMPCSLWIDQAHWVRNASTRLFPADALALPGAHNRQNMLLVTAAALLTGLQPEVIEAGLRSFKGVPHRLEPLGLIAGMQAYNDSKATNYDAAAVGLRSVPFPAVVLAGGQTKQGDASEWIALLKQRACAIALFGEGARELHNLISAAGFRGDLLIENDLPSALDGALGVGERHRARSLLLSPACASFDQYTDFEARGEHFRALVKAAQSND